MASSKAYRKSSTLSVLDWNDQYANERLWLLTKTGQKSGVLIVRHAGNSIWHKGASIDRKNSDLYGIELITAGNLRFVQNGKEYIIEPGTVFIKRRGDNHFYEPGPAGFVHKRFVRLDGPVIESLIGELGIDQYDKCNLSHPADFALLQKKAIALISEQPPGYELLLSLLAFEILLFIAQDISGGLQYPPAVSASIEHMRRNLHHKISINELSQMAGVSNTQFFRFFKDSTGETPLAYYNIMKMKRAAELLKHTIMPIKEIAFNLGYEEPAYFTNLFRKTIGVSPRAYRKKL